MFGYLRLAAVGLAAALVLSGCVGAGQGSAEGWGQIAKGVGQVIGKTDADRKVAEVSTKIAQYCGALRVVATGGAIFAPERHQLAAQQAAVAVNKLCDSPPTDVESTLKLLSDIYSAVVAVRDGTVQGGA